MSLVKPIQVYIVFANCLSTPSEVNAGGNCELKNRRSTGHIPRTAEKPRRGRRWFGELGRTSAVPQWQRIAAVKLPVLCSAANDECKSRGTAASTRLVSNYHGMPARMQ